MAEKKRESHLPYLAPLANILPLVYDQSISYYEFLNRLYQAVDEALQTMDEAIEAADTVNQKLEGFRVELREIKADIERRMTLAEQKVDGFDGRMRFIEQDNIELNKKLVEEKEYLLGEIVKNANVVIDFRRAYQTTFQNVKHELGGSYDFADVYHPNLLDCPKLYKGPGTLSEEKGDIPALAQFIDDSATEIREELDQAIEEAREGIGALTDRVGVNTEDIRVLQEGKRFIHRENTLGTSIDIGEMLREEGIDTCWELVGKTLTIGLAIAQTQTSSGGTSILKLGDNPAADNCPLLKPETLTNVTNASLVIEVTFIGKNDTDEIFVEYKPHYSTNTSRLFGGINATNSLGYSDDIYLKLDLQGFSASTTAQCILAIE